MRTRRIISFWIGIATAFVCGMPVLAQPSGAPAPSGRILAASELNTRDPEIIKRAHQYPKIDPARELKGESLLRALRQGGYVLYMRHTQTGTITSDCNISNLTQAGGRDARFIGESIRALRIPIDRVISSPICRVLDTARLIELGAITPARDLSNDAGPERNDLASERAARLAEMPLKGTNRILLSHTHAGGNPLNWMQLDYGEIIVYLPGAGGSSEPIARVRADDWYQLLALDIKK